MTKEGGVREGNAILWNNQRRMLACKGLAKLGNIAAEIFLPRQMYLSLAAQETYFAATNFAARKQMLHVFRVTKPNLSILRQQIGRVKNFHSSREVALFLMLLLLWSVI